MTLDEIGVLLAKVIRKLSAEERKRLGAALLQDLWKPVGKLRRKN
jgi:deoxycytidylate deaminase